MRIPMKKWCPVDIKKLIALYYIGATDQEIEVLSGRSPQSIAKKITRLKLRPRNTKTHIVTPGRHFPKNMNPADLSLLLKQILDIMDGTDSFIEALLKRYPLHKRPKLSSKKAKPFDVLEEDNSQWRSLKEIGQFIQERRHSVTEQYCTKTGATHLVDGQKKSPLDLLMIANKIRLSEEKTIFFLEDYTQY